MKDFTRVQKFLHFVQRIGLYGGVSWFQNEYHVSITDKNGNKYSYNHDFNLDKALDATIQDLRKVGLA